MEFCRCSKCAFYAAGQQYSLCILPQYLTRGFRLRDADKVRNAVENCHCKSELLAEIYKSLETQQDVSDTVKGEVRRF